MGQDVAEQVLSVDEDATEEVLTAAVARQGDSVGAEAGFFHQRHPRGDGEEAGDVDVALNPARTALVDGVGKA